jgi:hypothetical protein
MSSTGKESVEEAGVLYTVRVAVRAWNDASRCWDNVFHCMFFLGDSCFFVMDMPYMIGPVLGVARLGGQAF